MTMARNRRSIPNSAIIKIGSEIKKRTFTAKSLTKGIMETAVVRKPLGEGQNEEGEPADRHQYQGSHRRSLPARDAQTN